jgi:hypothetical protein
MVGMDAEPDRLVTVLAAMRHGLTIMWQLPRFLIQRSSVRGQMSKTIAHFALDFQRQESVSVAVTDLRA